jgi:hypothetical protein
MQQDLDVGGLPVEAVLLVANVLDGVADHLLDVIVGDARRSARFAGDNDLVGGGQRFARGADRPRIDAGFRPSRKNRSTISSEIRSQTLSG